MINVFNKYFALIMCFMILFTIGSFYKYQNKVRDFINNSTNHVVIIENNNNFNKDVIKIKLENLTHQNVEVEEINNKIYVSIKCPPEKKNYFTSWILDKKWLD